MLLGSARCNPKVRREPDPWQDVPRHSGQSFARACTRTVLPGDPSNALHWGYADPGYHYQGIQGASVRGARLPLDPHETSSAKPPKVSQRGLLPENEALLAYSGAPVLLRVSRVERS